MRKIALSLACIGLGAVAVQAGELVKSGSEDRSGLRLTLYNNDRALIQEERTIKVPAGQSQVLFGDVSAQIEPNSLIVKSGGDLRLWEQNYEFDLITSEKLLDKYVGRKVTLMQNQGPGLPEKAVEATLLANNGSPIFDVGGQVHVGMPGRIVLPALPENLAARPSLKWLVSSAKGGAQKVDVSYLSRGMEWKADYVVAVDSSDQWADFTGWITLNNRSGTSYTDAKLKLIAGEVRQAPVEMNMPMAAFRGKAVTMEMDMAGGGEAAEKAFDDYHLYEIPWPVSVADQQVKQVRMFAVEKVPVKKVYRSIVGGPVQEEVEGGWSKSPVEMELRFQTGKEGKLDQTLAAGVARVYKRDADGGQIFVGEDRVKHLPKGEKVRLRTGEAFDVVTEWRQVESKRIDKKTLESVWEATVRNRKAQSVQVELEQDVWGDVSLVAGGAKGERLNANRFRFVVDVPASQSQTIRYTFRHKER